MPALGWAIGLGLGLAFLAGNVALQFGASRLPAHVTAVVMLGEVLFASVSAALWGDGRLTAPLVAGGTLIVAAAVLAAAGARAPH
jgi:drug/metabolite transporter (DMT)-like permease